MDEQEQIRKYWPFHQNPPQRVVIKIGSNVLARKEGGLNADRIADIVDSIAAVQSRGIEVILVSSGAVAAGRGILGLTRRPTEIPELQAVAAIGQGALMEEYSRQFRRHNIIVAQMLLNRDDLDDRRRYLNARHALQSLLRRGVVPIINENDSVNIDELKFGDNDMLSAMIAAKMDADLLLILSNIPGLMTGHPKLDPTARLIPVVQRLSAEHEALVQPDGSELGTGGMKTKLDAARHATMFGVTTAIVDGQQKGMISTALTGSFRGTLFLARSTKKAGDLRRHWISSRRPKGELVVDDGAERALVEKHRSLLPVGVRQIEGKFLKGDVVRIVNLKGRELAHGIVNYDSETATQLLGKKKDELHALLGEAAYEELVHCDNLVLKVAVQEV